MVGCVAWSHALAHALHGFTCAGVDSQVRVWDVRTFKPLHSYFAYSPATSLDISQRGLLAVGYGRKVQVGLAGDESSHMACKWLSAGQQLTDTIGSSKGRMGSACHHTSLSLPLVLRAKAWHSIARMASVAARVWNACKRAHSGVGVAYSGVARRSGIQGDLALHDPPGSRG